MLVCDLSHGGTSGPSCKDCKRTACSLNGGIQFELTLICRCVFPNPKNSRSVRFPS